MKLSLIFLALLQMHDMTQVKEEQSLVESACSNTPNYELCVATLDDSPLSGNTDVAGLGLILVDVVKSKAEAALSAVEDLRRRHPEMRSALDQCWISYKAVIVADVPEAVAALTKGVPKFAESGMSDAAWEAEICEASFRNAAPLSGVNKEIHDLAQVAVAIIRILL